MKAKITVIINENKRSVTIKTKTGWEEFEVEEPHLRIKGKFIAFFGRSHLGKPFAFNSIEHIIRFV